MRPKPRRSGCFPNKKPSPGWPGGLDVWGSVQADLLRQIKPGLPGRGTRTRDRDGGQRRAFRWP